MNTIGIEQYLFKGPWADMPPMPRAACKGRSDLPWAGESGGGPGVTATMQAVCRACEHLTECLTFALSNPEVEGVWGGTTTAQRRNQAALPTLPTDAPSARASSSRRRRAADAGTR